MLTINREKTLNIILPNTNKALKTVLQESSKGDLQKLSLNKDLNSIMNSLLKQSANDATQDKKLLNLLKNNPTLKELGKVSTTIKELLHTLKLEKTPLKFEKTLTASLGNIKNIDEKSLKTKLENSGLFVENKLKNLQTPKQELHTLLNKFSKSLEDTKLPNLKTLQTELKELLKSDSFGKTDVATKEMPLSPKTSLVLKEKILSSTHTLLKALENVKEPKVQEIKTELKELLSKNSFTQESKELPKKELLALVSKLSSTQTLKTPTPQTPKIETLMTQLTELLADTKEQQTLNHLTKKVETLLNKFEERINSSVNKSIKPDDVLFSKETKTLLSKIITLNKPEQLTMQTKIKELFSQDFKVLLHQAHEEISASSSPNKQELLKHIDKLSLQIDYHQLVSHLSNSTSLYIPYSWDALEDGTISMKNQNNEKFFTDINLQLKEYGELKLRLGLFEKSQLNINISTQNDALKSMMQETLPLLKKQLFDAGLNPKEIRFLETKQNLYNDTNTELAVGFEVKA